MRVLNFICLALDLQLEAFIHDIAAGRIVGSGRITKTIKSPTEMLERESTKRCFAKLSSRARIVNGCSSLTNDDFPPPSRYCIGASNISSFPHSFSSPGKIQSGEKVFMRFAWPGRNFTYKYFFSDLYRRCECKTTPEFPGGCSTYVVSPMHLLDKIETAA